jgi:hypothetical protein
MLRRGPQDPNKSPWAARTAVKRVKKIKSGELFPFFYIPASSSPSTHSLHRREKRRNKPTPEIWKEEEKQAEKETF